MAITAGAAVKQEGTQVVAIADSGAINAGEFNAGVVNRIVPDDTVYTADFVLDVQPAAVPLAGGTFSLYRRDMDIDGDNSAPTPTKDVYEHTFVQAFPVALMNTRQYLPLTAVPISKDQEFYIKNDTNQATLGTTTLKITPNTPNAKAQV